MMGEGQEPFSEWLDRFATQVMDSTQPAAKPTSRKVQESLPEVFVRSAGSEGEPKKDEAFACAGEPCSVCHEDFVERESVVELPCSHVRVCFILCFVFVLFYACLCKYMYTRRLKLIICYFVGLP